VELREVDADECGRLSLEAAFHTDDGTSTSEDGESGETYLSLFHIIVLPYHLSQTSLLCVML